MLAAALRFFLLSELATYAGVAHWAFDLSWPPAIAAAFAWFLGGRAGFIAVTYLFSVAYHSPAPRIGVWSAIRMVSAELASFLALFVLIQPFERLWMGDDRLRPGRRLVLLIHGYGCNRGAWWWLRRRLEANGHSVASINLEPPYTDIENFVEPLTRRIEAACAEAACGQLSIVAHSMGGLVARAYLRKHGAARVQALVTLASPHGGTELARFGIGPNARQMEPGSAWLETLNRDLAAMPPVPACAIRNSHDNFVMPQDGQRLAGGADIELPALGHLSLLFSARAARALGEALGGE